jgi:hypothetical protein
VTPELGRSVAAYVKTRQCVAGILYVRNRLAADVEARRAEVARLPEGPERSARERELGRAEAELREVRAEAAKAKADLVELCEAIGAADRARLRDLARELATACEIAREVDGDPLEARFRAFERAN